MTPGIQRTIADLQRQLAEGPGPSDWLAEVTGSVTDESAFREVLEYGRAVRAADRLSDEADDPQ